MTTQQARSQEARRYANSVDTDPSDNYAEPGHPPFPSDRAPMTKPLNGRVQARCGSQRSNVACNPVLARTLRL